MKVLIRVVVVKPRKIHDCRADHALPHAHLFALAELRDKGRQVRSQALKVFVHRVGAKDLGIFSVAFCHALSVLLRQILLPLLLKPNLAARRRPRQSELCTRGARGGQAHASRRV